MTNEYKVPYSEKAVQELRGLAKDIRELLDQHETEKHKSDLRVQELERRVREAKDDAASQVLAALEEIGIGEFASAAPRFTVWKDGRAYAVPPDAMTGVFEAIRAKYRSLGDWSLMKSYEEDARYFLWWSEQYKERLHKTKGVLNSLKRADQTPEAALSEIRQIVERPYSDARREHIKEIYISRLAAIAALLDRDDTTLEQLRQIIKGECDDVCVD